MSREVRPETSNDPTKYSTGFCDGRSRKVFTTQTVIPKDSGDDLQMYKQKVPRTLMVPENPRIFHDPNRMSSCVGGGMVRFVPFGRTTGIVFIGVGKSEVIYH